MPYLAPGEPPAADATSELRAEYRERVQEREVRLAAQRILANHLRWGLHPHRPALSFWIDTDLDLRGATLIDFRLYRCRVRIAEFRDARFIGETDLLGIRFDGYAAFGNAKFCARSTFNQAQFGGKAEFVGTHFAADAGFAATLFTGDAEFASAHFGGSARFEASRFDRDASYVGARFAGTTSFKGAQFHGDTWFGHADFQRRPILDGAQFTRGVPDKLASFMD